MQVPEPLSLNVSEEREGVKGGGGPHTADFPPVPPSAKKESDGFLRRKYMESLLCREKGLLELRRGCLNLGKRKKEDTRKSES